MPNLLHRWHRPHKCKHSVGRHHEVLDYEQKQITTRNDSDWKPYELDMAWMKVPILFPLDDLHEEWMLGIMELLITTCISISVNSIRQSLFVLLLDSCMNPMMLGSWTSILGGGALGRWVQLDVFIVMWLVQYQAVCKQANRYWACSCSCQACLQSTHSAYIVCWITIKFMVSCDFTQVWSLHVNKRDREKERRATFFQSLQQILHYYILFSSSWDSEANYHHS